MTQREPKSGLFLLHDFIEANGKTIKENNLMKQHQYPLGTLVEVKFDRWFGDGACMKVHARLWVIDHRRDCDGTPLYILATERYAFRLYVFYSFSEEELTPIEVTGAVRQGEDALEWDEEEVGGDD